MGTCKDDYFESIEECKKHCEEGKEVLLEYPYYNPETGKIINIYSLVKHENKYTIFQYIRHFGNDNKWFFITIGQKDSEADSILVKMCDHYFNENMMSNLRHSCKR